ncbi:hypothetical protein IWX49DRAFT_551071 [Phyllosticta citricarpa]
MVYTYGIYKAIQLVSLLRLHFIPLQPTYFDILLISKVPKIAVPVRLVLRTGRKRRHNPIQRHVQETARKEIGDANSYREFFEKLDKDIKAIRDDIDASDISVSQVLVKARSGDRSKPLRQLLAWHRWVIQEDSLKIGNHLTILAIQPLLQMIQDLSRSLVKSAQIIRKVRSKLPGPLNFNESLVTADIKNHDGGSLFPSVLRLVTASWESLIEQLDIIKQQKKVVGNFISDFEQTHVEGKKFASAFPTSDRDGHEERLDDRDYAVKKTVYWYQFKRIADFKRQLNLLNEYGWDLSSWEDWINPGP